MLENGLDHFRNSKFLLTIIYGPVTVSTLLYPELAAPTVEFSPSVVSSQAPTHPDVALLAAYPDLRVDPPLPGDDVPDFDLGPQQAERRADERYPTRSLVTPLDNTVRSVFTQAAQ